MQSETHFFMSTTSPRISILVLIKYGAVGGQSSIHFPLNTFSSSSHPLTHILVWSFLKSTQLSLIILSSS